MSSMENLETVLEFGKVSHGHRQALRVEREWGRIRDTNKGRIVAIQGPVTRIDSLLNLFGQTRQTTREQNLVFNAWRVAKNERGASKSLSLNKSLNCLSIVGTNSNGRT